MQCEKCKERREKGRRRSEYPKQRSGLQLEELSSESEPTSAPRLQFGGPNRPQMLPKGSLGDPSDEPWTVLGTLRGSVGRSEVSWDALWRSSGVLWSSSRALWELRGVILELSGAILEAFWADY